MTQLRALREYQEARARRQERIAFLVLFALWGGVAWVIWTAAQTIGAMQQ